MSNRSENKAYIDAVINRAGGFMSLTPEEVNEALTRVNASAVHADETSAYLTQAAADLRYLGISANAASATKLATARTINGVSFDGSANITISKLYKEDGTGYTVYVDNTGALNINGNIIHNGDPYIVYAQEVRTKDDVIVMRDGAIGGLAAGTYAGLRAKLYDGSNDGFLGIDVDGYFSFGDVVGNDYSNLVRAAGITKTPTNGYFGKYNSTTKVFDTAAIALADLPITATAGYLPFVSEGNLANSSVFQDVNGNVGVGTLAPSRTLSINGTSSITGISASSTSSVLTVSNVRLLGSISGNSQLITTKIGNGGNGVQENTWLVRDASGADWTTARIHQGLSIDVSFITPNTDTKVWWERDPYNNIQSWGNADSTFMTINAGNVGIGTSNPTAKLQVETLSTYGDELGAIKIKSTTANQFGYFSYLDQFEALSIQALKSGVGVQNILLNAQGGNIGIGTTNPVTKFEVKQTVIGEVARLTTTEGELGTITGSSYLGFGHFNESNPSALIGIEEASIASFLASIVFKTRDNNSNSSPTTKMTILPNGNVGIATTNPRTKLDVNGELSVAYNATYGIRLYNQDANNFASIGCNVATGSTANIVFRDSTGLVATLEGGKAIFEGTVKSGGAPIFKDAAVAVGTTIDIKGDTYYSHTLTAAKVLGFSNLKSDVGSLLELTTGATLYTLTCTQSGVTFVGDVNSSTGVIQGLAINKSYAIGFLALSTTKVLVTVKEYK